MTTQMSCGDCGVEFCLPTPMYEARRADGRTFYCPNGHGRCFRPTADQKRIAELERQLKARQRVIEEWVQRGNERIASIEELVGVLKECPGGCGWRSRRQIPRDPVAMGRGIERVRDDIAAHLMAEHGARAQPTRALVERT